MGNSEDSSEHEGKRSDIITLKKVYFHSVRVAPQSMEQFTFYEDTSITGGSDRYVLLTKEHMEPAIFHASGQLTHLCVTAAGAVQNRRLNSKVDEYTVRLRIDDQRGLKEIDSGFNAMLQLLKDKPKACENIAVSGGLVESRLKFHLEDTVVKVSNYTNDVFYFNRKVATKEDVPVDDGNTPDFLLKFPAQGVDYPSLKYPTGYNLNPLIPITDQDALVLQPEHVVIPCRATVYFQIKQGCYNFVGVNGQVKQIVLIPSIIAVKLHPPDSDDMNIARKAKRRRIPC